MDTAKIIFLLHEYLNHHAYPTPWMSDAKFNKISYQVWAAEELISWIANADEHLPWAEAPTWKETLDAFHITIEANYCKARSKKTKNMWNIVLKELDIIKLYLLMYD